MLPTSNILNNFHDKKRKIEYCKIVKLINKEPIRSLKKGGKNEK